MAMKKIAYMLQRFPYPTETFIVREILQLRAIGHAVTIFSTFPPPARSLVQVEALPLLSDTHYSPYLSLPVLSAVLRFFARAPRRSLRAVRRAFWQVAPNPREAAKVLLILPKAFFFANLLRRDPVDHIHAHFAGINSVAAQIVSDLTGIPYSVHIHAWDLFCRPPESVRRGLGMADGLVAISDYNRRRLEALGAHTPDAPLRVVHCGIDPAAFVPVSAALSTQPDRIFRLVSVGSLVEKKGHNILIDACSRLMHVGRKFTCDIIGSGPLRDALQTQIDSLKLSDHVHLLGARPQAEIIAAYRNADLFALACTTAQDGDMDGIPVVLMEAMSLQLPVVSTRVSGIPELIQDGENGLLVADGDADALANACARLIDDPALCLRLGRAARQTVCDNFDLHHTAFQMSEFFEEIQPHDA